jgi:hypothetical protein
MTTSMMRQWGVSVECESYTSLSVPACDYHLTSSTYQVEGDYSAAGYFFAIAALHKKELIIENLHPHSKQGDKKYSKSLMRELPLASAHTPYLISQALEILREIYKDGFRYAKAGVGFVGLVPDTEQQQNLFVKTDHHKNNRLMKAVDELNNRFGDETVTFTVTGKKREWKMKSEFRSPRYTTMVDELPRVK